MKNTKNVGRWALAVAILGLAACGGGGESSPPGNSPPPATTTPPVQSGVAPRILTGKSDSSTMIRVEFNTAMNAAAEEPSNYQLSAKQGVIQVPITDVALNDARNIAVLTTASQTNTNYLLKVIAMAAQDGTPFAPPSHNAQPTEVTSGTAPDQDVDSDGDTLIDSIEVNGWKVTVTDRNGVKTEQIVTSNPYDIDGDTDNDGLGDQEENNISSNPRNADTDGDREPSRK